MVFPVDPELEARIEDYYLNLYADRWLSKERGGWDAKTKPLDAAQAMARTPTVMMWDDHDIFDGWGSYSCEMQHSPLFIDSALVHLNLSAPPPTRIHASN